MFNCDGGKKVKIFRGQQRKRGVAETIYHLCLRGELSVYIYISFYVFKILIKINFDFLN